MAVAPLRRGLPLDEPRERPPSPREAARWITTHPHRRNRHINDRLPRLLDHCPELRHSHDLVRRFATMLDNRDATPMPGWLNDLANSGLAPLAGLARALREDRHAVAQGITTLYDSGVNEGRITDIKLQKRLMAGRAGIPLLRQRVVLIAHLRRRRPGRWARFDHSPRDSSHPMFRRCKKCALATGRAGMKGESLVREPQTGAAGAILNMFISAGVASGWGHDGQSQAGKMVGNGPGDDSCHGRQRLWGALLPQSADRP